VKEEVSPGPENAKKAKDYIEKILSIDPGHAAAIRDLGLIYHLGVGVEKNLAKAERLYLQSADLNDMQAQHVLGVYYDYNGEYETDVEKAFRYHELAVRNGNHSSIDCMGAMFTHDRGAPKGFDIQFLFDNLCEGVKRSDSDCFFRLATVLEKLGRGEDEMCFQLYKSAADSERPPMFANNMVAKYFQYGFGCDRDLDNAEKYYQLEIDLYPNDEASYYNLSYLVANRRRDLVKAKLLSDKAVKIVAQDSINFGMVHRWSADLCSVMGDISIAREILYKLVCLGVEGAELQLHFLEYRNSVGGSQDKMWALSCIQEAAKNNDLEAMNGYSHISLKKASNGRERSYEFLLAS